MIQRQIFAEEHELFCAHADKSLCPILCPLCPKLCPIPMPFCAKSFAAINRYRMILNRLSVFWPEHSLQAGGRRFETCTAHQQAETPYSNG